MANSTHYYLRSARNKYKFPKNATILVTLEKNVAKSDTTCSPLHVECTQTWMRDLSSVSGSFNFRQPNHTCPAVNIQNKYRAAVADD